MRWQGRRESSQVEDRRRRGPGRGVAVGGCGTLVVVLVVSYLTGVDPLALLQEVEQAQVTTEAPGSRPGGGGPDTAETDELASFVKVVLADTEDSWTQLFAAGGQRYELPGLVLFSDAVQSACGFNRAAVGPFYCPADRKVYLDLGFFGELDRRFGAPGDFAQAYVVAHEVGHHVQNLLGISGEMHRLQQSSRPEEANALSVRLELQADCLAGVWGYHAARRDLLEPGDVEEGMAAAAAIGDDTLQRQAGGRVAPESWTHGSSEQRVRWLRRGLAEGDLDACQTFE